jgi:hypothetical protein
MSGEYVYMDVSPDSTRAIMSSFQFYAPDDAFPIEYWIIGSNDASSWTGLYHSTEAVVAGTYDHAGTGRLGAYTAETRLTKRDTYYQYVGIFVKSHRDPSNRTVIQELLLWGID